MKLFERIDLTFSCDCGHFILSRSIFNGELKKSKEYIPKFCCECGKQIDLDNIERIINKYINS